MMVPLTETKAIFYLLLLISPNCLLSFLTRANELVLFPHDIDWRGQGEEAVGNVDQPADGGRQISLQE